MPQRFVGNITVLVKYIGNGEYAAEVIWQRPNKDNQHLTVSDILPDLPRKVYHRSPEAFDIAAEDALIYALGARLPKIDLQILLQEIGEDEDVKVSRVNTHDLSRKGLIMFRSLRQKFLNADYTDHEADERAYRSVQKKAELTPGLLKW